MTIKAELETLAERCQLCADKDTSSIEEHLESCPVCREHKQKAEGFNQMMEKRAVMNATQGYFILKRMMVRNMFKKMLT